MENANALFSKKPPVSVTLRSANAIRRVDTLSSDAFAGGRPMAKPEETLSAFPRLTGTFTVEYPPRLLIATRISVARALSRRRRADGKKKQLDELGRNVYIYIYIDLSARATRSRVCVRITHCVTLCLFLMKITPRRCYPADLIARSNAVIGRDSAKEGSRDSNVSVNQPAVG